MNKQYDPAVFAAMQVGDPVATYQKTVPSNVGVKLLNPFNGEPEELIMVGKPGTPDSQVHTWSVAEDVFFKRMNRRHFENGNIIRVDAKRSEEPVTMVEQSSDEEVLKLVNSKFNALQQLLQKTESEAFVNRLLMAARQEEKSERIIKAIETRLSEIQLAGLTKEQ